MFSALIIIIGLIVFEAVNSIDNAIVNAYVLRTMSEKWRKIFLFWGILTDSPFSFKGAYNGNDYRK